MAALEEATAQAQTRPAGLPPEGQQAGAPVPEEGQLEATR